MKFDELKPLLYSIRDLAYVDEPQPEPHFQNPHDHAVYKATDVDAAIAELKSENRNLKRALWLARAERAHLKVLEYWPDYCHNAHCRIAEQKWDKVERKCRAKAEEYK